MANIDQLAELDSGDLLERIAAREGGPSADRIADDLVSLDGRSMTIHPHEGLLRAARAQARTEEFRQAYPTRSNIERTIAWTATQNSRRVRLRYIGTAKNDAWLHTRCAGLTQQDGAWAIA